MSEPTLPAGPPARTRARRLLLGTRRERALAIALVLSTIANTVMIVLVVRYVNAARQQRIKDTHELVCTIEDVAGPGHLSDALLDRYGPCPPATPHPSPTRTVTRTAHPRAAGRNRPTPAASATPGPSQAPASTPGAPKPSAAHSAPPPGPVVTATRTVPAPGPTVTSTAPAPPPSGSVCAILPGVCGLLGG